MDRGDSITSRASMVSNNNQVMTNWPRRDQDS